MERIAAVVVTYNRLNDLKKCLDSLREQTRPLEALYVINNGSTDGTGEWLGTQTDLIVVSQANLGGAGGFATGIETTYQAGFDWIWCMDDDCLAAPDALENLMQAPNIGPCIKNCMSISNQRNGELAFFVDLPHKAFRQVSDMTSFELIFGTAALFNGTLISAQVVKTIGIPDKQLFIWGDEVEYMTRAQKTGFPVVTVPRAVFYHPPAFDRNGLLWPGGVWKQYYAIRNQRRVFQNTHGNRYGSLIFLSWSLRVTMQQIREKRKNRMYNFLMYGEAALDSLMNNFRKRPESIFTIRLYRFMHK
ncbi:glycosyltransferase family 2 protein [Spirosoma koreense]